MRELRACDFCGEDADGVYEPLPRVDDGRRVALCAACRGTLADLLEPLTDDGDAEPRRTGTAASDTNGAGDEHGADRAGDQNGTPGTDATASSPDRAPSTTERDESGTVETETDEPETTDSGPSDEDPSDGADESGGTTRAEEPPGFRKVMRLLNNRSFPLERAVAAELASGAYELSEPEVEAVLDFAVERGVLGESDGKLRRT